MIYGIGIDLVKIERMKQAVDKWGEKFLRRVFTETEIAYCYGKSYPYTSLSVRFAAKEALIKAIGGAAAIPLIDIEVVNNKSGKPAIKAKGKLEEFFRENSVHNAHLSLSHEKDYGIASVIIEKDI